MQILSNIATLVAFFALFATAFAATPTACQAETWGWPGFVKGNNPWGAVLAPAQSSSLSSALSSACATYSSSGSTSSGTPITTSPVPVTSPVSQSASISTVQTRFTTIPTSSFASILTSVVPSSSFHSSSSTTSTSTSTSSSSSFLSKSSTILSSSATTQTIIVSSSSTSSSTSSPMTSTSTSTTSSVPQSTSSSTSGSNGSRASSSDVSTYLSTQNTVRAQHGASNLVWNNTLAAAAQKWSDGCVFQHSGGSLGPFGENLAAGTGSGYTITSAITSWTNEVSQYNSSNPQPSHFTQVVWKATTQVGCALTSCAGGSIFPASYGNANYVVCEYYPQGNVIGAFAQNVQA